MSSLAGCVSSRGIVFAVLLLFSALSSALLYAGESGPIESREGFVDPQSGARVEEVKKSFWSGKTRVLVSVPASDSAPATAIEEVMVTAKRPEADGSDTDLRYEFVSDYAADRYGMYIYLGKNADIPFRLYFKDASQEAVRHP